MRINDARLLEDALVSAATAVQVVVRVLRLVAQLAQRVDEDIQSRGLARSGVAAEYDS